MHQAWKMRLLIAFLALGCATYLLVPTGVYFSLSEDQLKEVRQKKEAFAKYLPKWAIESHIVPGLDLQGGIHMVLGVDVDKALNDRIGRTADRIKQFATDKNLKVASVEPEAVPQNTNRIRVKFASDKDVEAFKSQALDQFGELKITSTETLSMALSLDPSFEKKLREDAVDQTIKTIRTRVDKMGITEPTIAKRGVDQIQIQLPGYDDPQEAKSLIGRTAQLEFQMCDDESEFVTKLADLPAGVELVKSGYGRPDGTGGRDIFLKFSESKLEQVRAYLKERTPPENSIKFGKLDSGEMRTYTLLKKVELTGDDLVDAHVSMGSAESPRPAVGVTFSPTGAKIFDELTARTIGKRMAIVLEDLVDSAPVIQVRISGGSASISMGGNRTRDDMIKDANQLSLVLKAGALPAPVTFREERSVGPSLGADSVHQAKQAFIAGSLLVIIFMIWYYRLAGVISIIGVIFNVAFILAVLSWLGATITLPGVAGLLLTIGMAVDANVIIDERIREEMRLGKTPRSAVAAGYHAAFTAIIDSHATQFISGIVLWQFGTGPVQNFATMLVIGTVTSVITAVFVTRIFFDMITAKGPATLSI